MNYNEIKEKFENWGWIIPLDKLDLGKNYGIFLKIGIVSETTGYFINRNNEPTEVTSEEFEGDNRVVVPASKWRGAERTFILSILRKAGLVDHDYFRNMVKKKSQLANPASLLWGDSSIGSNTEAAGIASRSFYDWAYSFQPLSEILLKLMHNTLGDDGSILKKDKDSNEVASNAIYNTNYIIPGVKFVRFITLENISFEMLLLQIMAILGTTRYGARTAILGDNIQNKIIAISASKGDMPVTSYTIMDKAWKDNKFEPETMIIEAMQNNYTQIIKGKELDELLDLAKSLVNNNEEMKKIYEPVIKKMNEDWKYLFKSK
ncbi:MAG: type I-D CRISPR-associated protein Cas7/Csc2 [Thermoplasmata archaeon]